uniref:TAFII28-like protein domain-containing protein n=1 Tax=Oncorhynchus tshawytscha TaxID=74940 RepID=A0A8C8C8B8_ONCTS
MQTLKIHPHNQSTNRTLWLEMRMWEPQVTLLPKSAKSSFNCYEMYRRSAFPKAAIKKLMQSITGSSVSQNVVIAMSVKDIAGGDMPPLQPKHMREAKEQSRSPI